MGVYLSGTGVSNLVHGSSLVLSDDRTLPALIASMGVQLAQSELDNMQQWQAAGKTPVEISNGLQHPDAAAASPSPIWLQCAVPSRAPRSRGLV